MITKVGIDAELFVTKNNEIVPCLGIIEGTKECPLKTPNGYIHEDNVLAEINTLPGRVQDLRVSLQKVLLDLEGYLSMHNAYSITPQNTFSFHDFTHIHEIPQYLIAGCDPENNIYGRKSHIRFTSHIRSAGFHLHIDLPEYVERPEDLVLVLDAFLGLHQYISSDVQERLSIGYGWLGSYRIKPYGIEYRTLSSEYGFAYISYIQTFLSKISEKTWSSMKEKAESFYSKMRNLRHNQDSHKAMELYQCLK